MELREKLVSFYDVN